MATSPPGRQTLGRQAQYVRATQSLFDEPVATNRGRDLALSAMLLKIAMVLGSTAVKLAARLPGPCEINCWADGPNRAWPGDVVQSGPDVGLYRPDLGWEAVRDLLTERNDCPVVVSWADDFPAPWTAPTAGDSEPDDQERQTLATAERWRLALENIHARAEDELEIRPDWASYRFGHNVSFPDLLTENRDARLDQALGVRSQ
ncbi:hypothetical protein [Streptomyces yaizuensis]|uniref:Uncharacterized protein n=1 Tax=Streptomyces yaizuensis TaxID=2989713 RepID=A0ABQ5P6U6_9ACTN|nr:hypothetical protein [Streptomyces sp. YSPA8]GLF98198.1 hypothetical protein SYYSPA8_27895 [Streptomyces sp. YSPA8]